MNDAEFLHKKTNIDFEEMYQHLKKNWEKKDIFITDTSTFKHFVFSRSVDVFMFDVKICHLGLSRNRDEIRDTLFEFFLITNCAKIKTYCKIHQISGFVKWISKIYDIPVYLI